MKIEIGDKVFHKSNSAIIWVVDKIEGEEVYCSTVLNGTFERKNEKFTLTSLQKAVNYGGGIYISKGRSNHY